MKIKVEYYCKSDKIELFAFKPFKYENKYEKDIYLSMEKKYPKSKIYK